MLRQRVAEKGRSPGELLRGDEVRTSSRVLGGSVRLEIAPCLLTRYQRVGRKLAIEREFLVVILDFRY